MTKTANAVTNIDGLCRWSLKHSGVQSVNGRGWIQHQIANGATKFRIERQISQGFRFQR